MAEIKIEKKKPVWPWIILVLIILAILYFLVFADDDDEELEDVDQTEQVMDETALNSQEETASWEEEETASWDETSEAGAVSGYLAYVSDESKMGIDHRYTNNALIELMKAVEAKAKNMEIDIEAEMQSIREKAQAIKTDPQSGAHANKIKEAGIQLAEILKNIQEQKFPDLGQDVEEVQTAANNIDGAVQTLEQKDQINKFFNEAADVLRKMS